MTRLIDADATIVALERAGLELGARGCIEESANYFIAARILRESAPLKPIEAEPVRHGKWKWYVNWGCTAHLEPIEPYDAGWACSICGIDLVQYLKNHFPDIPSYLECACEEMPTLERCPHCGAKMDLEG
jgi:hypothetical protein